MGGLFFDFESIRTRCSRSHPQGDINNKIGFTDGIMGSTGLDKLKEQNTGGNNPGVEGALDVDPDVIGGYTCATAEAAGVKFELTTLAKMGRFDQEVSIDMPAASDIPRLETIQVKPVRDSASVSEKNSRRWRRRDATPPRRRRWGRTRELRRFRYGFVFVKRRSAWASRTSTRAGRPRRLLVFLSLLFRAAWSGEVGSPRSLI